jgi:PPK2 family polyphosphate:nucleotide phosphotransferase
MSGYRVTPDSGVALDEIDPNDTGGYDGPDGKTKAKAKTDKLIEKLAFLQDRLYANAGRSLLIILQGMDTSGKDGTIKHVMSGVNPMGCHVRSFKVPTPKERAHDFLWRVHPEVPAAGYIGIFNRSHYEDVLVTRVHGMVSKDLVGRRFKQIRDFERHLAQNGTVILKFYLHISKDEQRRRLQDRIDTPKKRWKFNPGDLRERALWNDYQRAYEDAIGDTGSKEAPWYIVPADHKWYRDWVVSRIVLKTMDSLKLQYPQPAKGLDFKKIKVK